MVLYLELGNISKVNISQNPKLQFEEHYSGKLLLSNTNLHRSTLQKPGNARWIDLKQSAKPTKGFNK